MKLLQLNKVKDGRYLKNYELTYLNRAGKEKIYEIVSRKELKEASDLGNKASGLSIVAVCDGKLLLLEEFRMGINKKIYNLCAGMLEDGESIEECVKRELYEETGLTLIKIKKILPASYSAVAISDIKTYIVFAEVCGTLGNYASYNEDIRAGLYTKKEVRSLLETAEFSSRAQMAAYYFSLEMSDSHAT